MKLKKQFASLLIVASLMSSTLPINVLAVENLGQNEENLCEHHQEHNEECGYSEGSERSVCTHVHTEECYSTTINCINDDAYLENDAALNIDTQDELEPTNPIDSEHVCSEETGCIKKELNCKHEHDSECGYSLAKEETPCNYICEICNSSNQQDETQDVKMVVDWTWNNIDENMPVLQNDHWQMTIPSTFDNQPLSKNQVIDLLPKEVVLTYELVNNNQEVNVDLNLENSENEVETNALNELTKDVVLAKWDILDYPDDGATSGNFIATINLPEDYMLKDDVMPLQITLLFPQLLVNNQSRISKDILKKHEINTTITPSGTKINLFDYWLDDSIEKRWDPEHQPLLEGGKENHDQDLAYDVNHKSIGINKNHVFKFVAHGGNVIGYNRWTGGIAPFTGIVKNTLDKNGYPEINDVPLDFYKSDINNNIYDVDNDKVGSLSYLFNPKEDHVGKISFENVKNLLQIDENGYYYYDTEKNYARFDEENKSFILYDSPALFRKSNENAVAGQFFPFQTEEQVTSYYESNEGSDGKLIVDKTKNPSSDQFNHYFGLTLETRFLQKNYGRDYRGQDITYEFSGDDDVWVFIDGVLIADLGGIHDKATFEVNFQNGVVSINGVETSTIKQQFESAGKYVEGKFNGNTFANNTYHTLKFFYLERGNHESKMMLRYNLFPIPESELIKVNQMGHPLEGALFEMYSADESYNNIKDLLFTGVTDKDGQIYLRDDFGVPITFAYLYDEYGAEYYVLKEGTLVDQQEVLPGYRKLNDIFLHYKIYNKEENIGIIETEQKNLWATGAYA